MRSTGDRLLERLRDNGMSKRGLAREARVSYRTVCRMTSGDRVGYLDTWMRVSGALGCEVSDLTGERDG